MTEPSPHDCPWCHAQDLPLLDAPLGPSLPTHRLPYDEKDYCPCSAMPLDAAQEKADRHRACRTRSHAYPQPIARRTEQEIDAYMAGQRAALKLARNKGIDYATEIIDISQQAILAILAARTQHDDRTDGERQSDD